MDADLQALAAALTVVAVVHAVFGLDIERTRSMSLATNPSDRPDQVVQIGRTMRHRVLPLIVASSATLLVFAIPVLRTLATSLSAILGGHISVDQYDAASGAMLLGYLFVALLTWWTVGAWQDLDAKKTHFGMGAIAV